MAQKKSGATPIKKPRRTKRPEPMPSLVFNGGVFEPSTETPRANATQPSVQKNATLNNYELLLKREQTGRRWLWIGVISFMAVIGTIWIFSIKLQISNYHYQGSTEQLFIEKNKSNWNAVFKETPSTATNTTSQQKIKEVLTLILENASTSTSSNSISTTTTPTTTNRY